MNRALALIPALLLACGTLAPARLEALGGTTGQAMQAADSAEQLILPDVDLIDSRGRSRSLFSRYGQAGLVLFGFVYTHCTESCGMTISVLGIVDMELQQPGAPPLRLVALSIDPQRDTPAVLAEMADLVQAGPNWDWVVAPPDFTPMLLSGFGLPPGPPQTHAPVYVMGDLRDGRFWRLPGDAQPYQLLDMARQITAETR